MSLSAPPGTTRKGVETASGETRYVVGEGPCSVTIGPWPAAMANAKGLKAAVQDATQMQGKDVVKEAKLVSDGEWYVVVFDGTSWFVELAENLGHPSEENEPDHAVICRAAGREKVDVQCVKAVCASMMPHGWE